MILVGNRWAEAHHDVSLVDEQGTVLGKKRVELTGMGWASARCERLVATVGTY